ncbi:tRNA pseudouridine synthase D [Thelephora ganbajun]|uniref:tRNA pseudouridine synthase D n=1 Tax=Thelephora ganbajun TaxID=370292 RepID=A0ACB6Z9I3_THEGA|nr:tRNA pseudouridine synthase D [Thelephora ganbajun]
MQMLETDVGISEYVGRDIPPIQAVIKQRFTDFLVFEIDQNDRAVHLKSLAPPEPSSVLGASNSVASQESTSHTPQPQAKPSSDPALVPEVTEDVSAPIEVQEGYVWSKAHTTVLEEFLSPPVMDKLKQMYEEGPEPPFVSDSGWGGRQAKQEESEVVEEAPAEATSKRGRGKGRGGRGGHGRDRGPRTGKREDDRKVVTEPIADKAVRTELHKAIRQLFKGNLDSETETTPKNDDDGSRISIGWVSSGGRRGAYRGLCTGSRGNRPSRGNFPPYIHFTLQKTNRDTHDALSYIARFLHANVKDLGVAGTKDKRGVTVQRVSLKRGSRAVEDVWRIASSQNSRNHPEDSTMRRGDHGVRIADFNYRKAPLELGMLKGNQFVITLRNVQIESMETLERAMSTIKYDGFINYYGMQRFGTASIPTHLIGLALLQSDWHKAVSLILQLRHGEHPEVCAARKAWLDERDLEKALQLMPRRLVAERAVLESYKKQRGDTRNAMGALSTIPRNLRLMYIHAYQSYVWNAIVSERIKMCGAGSPVVGDLVYEEPPKKTQEEAINQEEDEGADDPGPDPFDDRLMVVSLDEDVSGGRPAKKPWVPPKVKTLTEEDLAKYTIFDVIMPLPGIDVAFPGGILGDRYRQFLTADGLDPNNFHRKQKDYCLGGSYRHILHLPRELSWSVLRYTDPDVPLAQADEDKLLGFDPPAAVEDGKFMALQINLSLGTAAYATMALREVTKTETSSHYQSALTQASEDQKFKKLVESASMDVDPSAD